MHTILSRSTWLWAVLYPLSLFAEPIITPHDIVRPVQATEGMVVSSDATATRIGVDILRQGGNAVDAAVAVGFALSVTYPRAGNIGGGGFMLIYDAETQQVEALDYRETAPAKAHRDMYLDAAGEPDPQLSRFSHLAAGVPGTVAGFSAALEKYGSLTWAEVSAPAVRLAEQGILVEAPLREDIASAAERLRGNPASRAVFFKADGGFYEVGERWLQPDLARTLKRIAEHGPQAFYGGPVGELIAAEMKRHGGLIDLEDLKAYRVQWRTPVHGTYRGYDVYSMSPPSSGGAHIVQILNLLEPHNLRQLGHNTAATLHRMAEAMKRAFADRAQFLGDPDFVAVPLTGLTGKAYAAALQRGIDLERATPSADIAPGRPSAYESDETTHFVVVDRHGNAVSNTTTLNFSFGSGIMVAGAGFLLNNEMDDFSAKPGVPNAYGLVGGDANAVAPHKRMLSSMSPTIVLHRGKPFLLTGSPGGPRIITTTLQVILNLIDHGMNLQEAVNAVRIHHQWLPDILFAEEGLSGDTVRLLESMGHTVQSGGTLGAAHSIAVGEDVLYGAADPRRAGGLASGH